MVHTEAGTAENTKAGTESMEAVAVVTDITMDMVTDMVMAIPIIVHQEKRLNLMNIKMIQMSQRWNNEL